MKTADLDGLLAEVRACQLCRLAPQSCPLCRTIHARFFSSRAPPASFWLAKPLAHVSMPPGAPLQIRPATVCEVGSDLMS